MLAVAALVFWAWRYWQKRRAQAQVVPVVPPHIRAKQKLREALALIGQPREFCILVSDTVRWYLEERFDFHAPERTTEEFLYELQGTNLLTPDQKDSLGEFLKRCDLVKFAKYEPGPPELRRPARLGGAAGGGNGADHGHAGSRQDRRAGMTFGHPYVLLLLLLLPVLGWLKGKQGKPPAFVYSSVQLVRGILNVTRTRSGAFLAALRWLTLALLIIALAQPRLTQSETKVTASGVDIAVALDLSGSMASEDFEVGRERLNRLAMAKEVLKKFIDKRPNDRIGIVAFATQAYIACPADARPRLPAAEPRAARTGHH